MRIKVSDDYNLIFLVHGGVQEYQEAGGGMRDVCSCNMFLLWSWCLLRIETWEMNMDGNKFMEMCFALQRCRCSLQLSLGRDTNFWSSHLLSFCSQFLESCTRKEGPSCRLQFSFMLPLLRLMDTSGLVFMPRWVERYVIEYPDCVVKTAFCTTYR
jgi:hypothetical protein